jgi:hypothetical protein
MKKLFRISVLFILCGLFLALLISLLLALYYRDNFPVNTWINGVYCTGKTMDEVNEELKENTVLPEIIIEEEDGEQWQLSLEEAGGYADYKTALRSYLRKNASGLWMTQLNAPVSASLDQPQFLWDSDKLSALFYGLDFVEEAENKETGVTVEWGPEGYYLADGNADRLNCEKAFAYLEKCLSNGETSIRLKNGDCYETLEDSADDKKRRLLWQETDEILSLSIVYDMGAEQIPLTVDDTGVSLKEEGIEKWVEELAAQYDTENTTRQFQSTRGDVVSVPYVTYGTSLDQEAETEWLKSVLWDDRQSLSETEYHIPTYLKEGFVRGLDDIGDTYIEIDMTMQHMYYYAAGEIVLETDVVTGNTGRKMGTPEGVNYVYNKQRNRVLRGADYATPVKYWVPIKGAVGIHDASWRSSFGGEIYKTNGSHGCINTPTDVMAQLYEMVEIGTPVITFY